VLGPAVAWIGLEWVYLFVTLVLFGVGVWAAGRAEIFFGQHDDGRIVIDEVAGQLITLSPLVFLFSQSASFSPDAPRATTELFPFFSWVVTGFVLFRLFDVWKPGPVRWAERRFEGGLGVMADDAVAGAFGAVVLCGLWALGSELGMTWK
jgi:phosphatidylglycerophosphatase A